MSNVSPKAKVLDLAAKRPTIRTPEIAAALGISRQFALTLVGRLLAEGKLLKIGSTRGAKYVVAHRASPELERVHLHLRNSELKEHVVLDKLNVQAHRLQSLPENVRSIFNYAFSEMLNNAIEHSRSKWIDVHLDANGPMLNFVVDDHGIGAFRNVMKERRLDSELEAIQDILKGKTTTQPQAHSGEGIFFTSRIADLFIIESFGWRLRVDNMLPDVFIEPIDSPKKGTRVIFSVAKTTKKHLNALFKKYQTGGERRDFGKTEVKIRLYTMGTIYVSRSQARRVLAGLEKFRRATLDFDRVPTIGQAFADEAFRVFPLRHPDTKILAVNANEAVQFMIDRTDTTALAA